MPWGAVGASSTALLVFADLTQDTNPQPFPKKQTLAGLVVIHVEADSRPPQLAWLRRYHLAVDDDAVNTMAELRHVIASRDPGDNDCAERDPATKHTVLGHPERQRRHAPGGLLAVVTGERKEDGRLG